MMYNFKHWLTYVFSHARIPWSPISVGSIVMPKLLAQFLGSKVALNPYSSIHVNAVFRGMYIHLPRLLGAFIFTCGKLFYMLLFHSQVNSGFKGFCAKSVSAEDIFGMALMVCDAFLRPDCDHVPNPLEINMCHLLAIWVPTSCFVLLTYITVYYPLII